MIIKLIEGEFKPSETLDLISQMIDLKIKFHESKISNDSNLEDIKYRESKIKDLQKELNQFRKKIKLKTNSVKVDSVILIE
jgi:hypothetical protein